MAGSTFSSMTDLQGTYSVFTGTDIYTVFADMLVSTMQGISYSITRQKAPIYTMGSPDPRAFARSKRGIAGSMIMTTFDRHALAEFMRGSQFAAKRGSMETSNINPMREGQTTTPQRSEITNSIQALSPYQIDAGLLASVGQEISGTLSSTITGVSVTATPMFTDQLLPFDTTLVGANEYGIGAKMRIFGLEVLNEGSGVSIDDTSNEVQMTYIARLISPWINQALGDGTSGDTFPQPRSPSQVPDVNQTQG